MKRAAILLFAVAGVAAGPGQTTGAPSGTKPETYTRETGAVRAQSDLNRVDYVRVASVAGRPFSAQIVTTIKRTAEDGTPQTIAARDLVARDAMGRWYRESRISPITGGYSPYGVSAQVWDVVGQTLLDLSIPQKIALVVRDEPANLFLAGALARPQPYARTGQYGGNASTLLEYLGERTINGLKVWGTRITETFAPEVMGTEKPLTMVTEDWYSDELGADMEIHVVNPVKGEKTIRLEQVDRHEPDQSLFQVPPGFTERFEQKR